MASPKTQVVPTLFLKLFADLRDEPLLKAGYRGETGELVDVWELWEHLTDSVLNDVVTQLHTL